MNFNDPFLHWQADYRPSAYLLAFSGGRDSVALLDALARAALSAPLALCHVHHGWSAQADVWADWCVAKAAEYGLPCEVTYPKQIRIAHNTDNSVVLHHRDVAYFMFFEKPFGIVQRLSWIECYQLFRHNLRYGYTLFHTVFFSDYYFVCEFYTTKLLATPQKKYE